MSKQTFYLVLAIFPERFGRMASIHLWRGSTIRVRRLNPNKVRYGR